MKPAFTDVLPRTHAHPGADLPKKWQAARRVLGLLDRFTPSLWLGLGVTTLVAMAALLGPSLAPYGADEIIAGGRLEAPSSAHLFGTDELGRDVFSRVLLGTRLALRMAFFGVAVSALIGIPAGLLAGYVGGALDQLASRLIDVFMAIPGLLLAIIIVARLGPSLSNAAIALGIVGIPSFFRLARSGALTGGCRQCVLSAKAIGASDLRILAQHILPNVAHSLVVLATMRLGMLILAGGGLSFIGLGSQPPAPEWGSMLAHSRDYLQIAPWMVIFPGTCITLTIIGFNLFGDGLRDALDPRA
jgi:ABC-type dipeptide/oligopeptide/nickel transport system permease subunit